MGWAAHMKLKQDEADLITVALELAGLNRSPMAISMLERLSVLYPVTRTDNDVTSLMGRMKIGPGDLYRVHTLLMKTVARKGA